MRQENVLFNVVQIASDGDDDDEGEQIRAKKGKTQAAANVLDGVRAHSSANATTSSTTLENRSFWKAGAYDIGPTKWTPAQGQLEHARVHPKFLHSNATSHKWAFGAIAELLDNAVDEINNGATFVKVDKIYNEKDNSPALQFLDDGGGMNPESVRKCMSLGYSSKKTNTTIGQYGNGFKTSTMRLGADAILFSRTSGKGRATQSVGLLSYTFLRKTGQDDVIVPMLDFDVSKHWADPIIYGSPEEWSSNLSTILEWSPFASKDDLMRQFDDIGSHGTKIIIFNLWLNDEGVFELSFDDDEKDIKLRDEANLGGGPKTKRALGLQSHISYQIRFSLRAYASILYLRKFSNFTIFIRGTPVEQLNVEDELRFTKSYIYRPQLAATSEQVSVETTFGFIKEAPQIGITGYNIYHKNRLIRPFWKVTSEGSSRGNGVVGILEANFIEPAHDKQDFERSSLYYKLEQRLKQMLIEYWRGHCHLIGLPPADPKLRILHNESQLKQPTVRRPSNTRSHITIPEPGPVQELATLHVPESRPIDQIVEENIQLFMRCEDKKLKELELKRTIAELEEQVKETKRKCVQLSLQIETKKQQNAI